MSELSMALDDGDYCRTRIVMSDDGACPATYLHSLLNKTARECLQKVLKTDFSSIESRHTEFWLQQHLCERCIQSCGSAKRCSTHILCQTQHTWALGVCNREIKSSVRYHISFDDPSKLWTRNNQQRLTNAPSPSPSPAHPHITSITSISFAIATMIDPSMVITTHEAFGNWILCSQRRCRWPWPQQSISRVLEFVFVMSNSWPPCWAVHSHQRH